MSEKKERWGVDADDLSHRLQPRGIRVNAVAPGPMDTPFFYPQEAPEAVAYHKSQALGGRLTDIKDIAPLVDFLTKDKWITGQIIFCESGKGTGDDGWWCCKLTLLPPANGGYTTR